MLRRTMATAVLAVAAVTVALVPTTAYAGHPAGVLKKHPNPLADPTYNTSPSQRFVNDCRDMRRTKAANIRCDRAALKDFDAVRKKEGLGPMTLPEDFATLSVPSQLLAISNIERVDRGRRPVLGRSKALDALALQGARDDTDPPWPNPFPGTSGGGNWAGAGNSALLDDFYWMYDDGLGSFNEDCTSSDRSGCWGHRHDILNDYQARLVMGAAVARHSRFGTSMTEEFIGGDRGNKVNVSPSWATILATFPAKVTISASETQVASGAAVTLTGTVTNRESGVPVASAPVELQQRRGSNAWRGLRAGHAGSNGVVSFQIHPTTTEHYRLVALGKHGSHRGASPAVRVVIA
jgi:hypothetical protein